MSETDEPALVRCPHCSQEHAVSVVAISKSQTIIVTIDYESCYVPATLIAESIRITSESLMAIADHVGTPCEVFLRSVEVRPRVVTYELLVAIQSSPEGE